MTKTYLGDSVYASYDHENSMIALTTENGAGETNRIWLEQEVVQAFMRFLLDVNNYRAQIKPEDLKLDLDDNGWEK